MSVPNFSNGTAYAVKGGEIVVEGEREHPPVYIKNPECDCDDHELSDCEWEEEEECGDEYYGVGVRCQAEGGWPQWLTSLSLEQSADGSNVDNWLHTVKTNRPKRSIIRLIMHKSSFDIRGEIALR